MLGEDHIVYGPRSPRRGPTSARVVACKTHPHQGSACNLPLPIYSAQGNKGKELSLSQNPNVSPHPPPSSLFCTLPLVCSEPKFQQFIRLAT